MLAFVVNLPSNADIRGMGNRKYQLLQTLFCFISFFCSKSLGYYEASLSAIIEGSTCAITSLTRPLIQLGGIYKSMTLAHNLTKYSYTDITPLDDDDEALRRILYFLMSGYPAIAAGGPANINVGFNDDFAMTYDNIGPTSLPQSIKNAYGLGSYTYSVGGMLGSSCTSFTNVLTGAAVAAVNQHCKRYYFTSAEGKPILKYNQQQYQISSQQVFTAAKYLGTRWLPIYMNNGMRIATAVVQLVDINNAFIGYVSADFVLSITLDGLLQQKTVGTSVTVFVMDTTSNHYMLGASVSGVSTSNGNLVKATECADPTIRNAAIHAISSISQGVAFGTVTVSEDGYWVTAGLASSLGGLPLSSSWIFVTAQALDCSPGFAVDPTSLQCTQCAG
jgi:hypothetical protein